MLNKEYKHTKNGLTQETVHTKNGYTLTVSIATGVSGEVVSLITDDNNRYPDSDSRSEFNHMLVPLDVEDLLKLRDSINRMVKVRNKTLIKK